MLKTGIHSCDTFEKEVRICSKESLFPQLKCGAYIIVNQYTPSSVDSARKRKAYTAEFPACEISTVVGSTPLAHCFPLLSLEKIFCRRL